MPPIPLGPDAAHPTRFLGADCSHPPWLGGSKRAERILNLEGSSHVHVSCPESPTVSTAWSSTAAATPASTILHLIGPWGAVGV